MSRRARRQQRGRRGSHVVLNIVSLIDIFAILVFYLLVDSLVASPLPVPAGLRLPTASAETLPVPGITIVIGTEQLLVDAKPVQSTALLRAGDSAGLRAALAQAPRGADGRHGEISVLADRRIPYRVLREVMNACGASDAAEVSLAVVERLPGGGA